MTKSCIVVRHVAFEDLGLLGPLVSARGYAVRYHDAGIEPFDSTTLVGADLVIVLGGPIGVYESGKYPFITGEIAAVVARIESNKPILGICLGAQMMAAALGARVAPGSVKEVGYAPLTLTAAGRRSVLGSLGSAPVLHWHGDNCDLPAGCERLASTPHCPVQAFARAPAQLGLQFHLETEPARLEAWLVGHAVELAAAGIDPCKLREEARTLGPTVQEAGSKVLAGWLDTLVGAYA